MLFWLKVEDRKCEYEKIALVGHKQSPTPEETAAFIESVNRFFEVRAFESLKSTNCLISSLILMILLPFIAHTDLIVLVS